MPEMYDEAGITFQYPDNWELEDSGVAMGDRSISLTEPGGAFWVLSVHPNANAPARMTEGVLKMMKEEYQGVEADPLTLELEGVELSGYEINFYCHDMTNTAYIAGFRDHRSTYIVMWQAVDHQWGDVEPMFQAITSSFLAGLKSDD